MKLQPKFNSNRNNFCDFHINHIYLLNAQKIWNGVLCT